MKNITITLEVTASQLHSIANILTASPETLGSPRAAVEYPSDSLPAEEDKALVEPLVSNNTVIVKPTASPKGHKKKPTMPSLGRKQSDIDSYEASEESRIDELDAKEEVKAEKKAIKEEQLKKETEIVEAIKEPEPVTTVKAVAPAWLNISKAGR